MCHIALSRFNFSHMIEVYMIIGSILISITSNSIQYFPSLFGVKFPRLEPGLWHFLAVWPWISHLPLLRAKQDSELDGPEPSLLTSSLYYFQCTKQFLFFLNCAIFSYGQSILGQASVLLFLLRLMTPGHDGPVFRK